MKTIKKMMMIAFVAIIALSQNACKKDCDDAVIKKQCLKQLRELEDNIDDLWEEGGPTCNDLYEALQDLKDECGSDGVLNNTDYESIKSNIDNHCAG